MKRVRLGGKSKLFHSVIAGIEKLMQNKEFMDYCSLWRKRNVSKRFVLSHL